MNATATNTQAKIAALALTAIAGSASAQFIQTQVQTRTIDPRTTTVDEQLVFDGFDSSLGILLEVQIDASASVEAASTFENTSNQTALATGSEISWDVDLSTSAAGLGSVLSLQASEITLLDAGSGGDTPITLDPFDGTFDFGGASGLTLGTSDSQNAMLSLNSGLGDFTDSPVTFDFFAETSTLTSTSGSGVAGGGTGSAGTEVTLTYIYDSPVPTPATAGLLAAGGLTAARRRRR